MKLIQKKHKISRKEAEEMIVEVADCKMEQEAREFFKSLIGHPDPYDPFVNYDLDGKEVDWVILAEELLFGSPIPEEHADFSELLEREKMPHDLEKHARLLRHAAEKIEDENYPTLLGEIGALIGDLDIIKRVECREKFAALEAFFCALVGNHRETLKYLIPTTLKQLQEDFANRDPREDLCSMLDNSLEEYPCVTNEVELHYMRFRCMKEELEETITWLKEEIWHEGKCLANEVFLNNLLAREDLIDPTKKLVEREVFLTKRVNRATEGS